MTKPKTELHALEPEQIQNNPEPETELRAVDPEQAQDSSKPEAEPRTAQSRAALDSPKSKPERRAVDPQQPHDSPAGADSPAPSELENSTMANKATSPNPATDNESAAPSTTPPDPFNLESLLLPQNYNETLGVEKVLRVVPVRKPNNQDYNRVHPGKEYRGNFAMIDLKDDRETYLVAGADLIAELESELVRVTLYTAINRQGVVFLWPVRLPGPDGRDMVWFSSARLAAEDAMKNWTRVQSNMSLGAYETTIAESISAKPNWPELSFGELISIAFRDRLITGLSHPVVKKLRGLA